MPRVSKEYSEARRRQIIDAAYRCFARKGFHQTTMRDIYEEAELSPGAIYNYFDSKAEIIEASFDFDYRRSLELFTAAEESTDPMKALDELFAFLFQGLKGAAELGAGRANVQGWGEALVNPRLLETIRRVLDSYLDAVSKVIHRAQALGQIDTSIDPLSLSRSLLSLYQGLELQRALDDDVDMDGYAETVRTLLRSVSRRPPTDPSAST